MHALGPAGSAQPPTSPPPPSSPPSSSSPPPPPAGSRQGWPPPPSPPDIHLPPINPDQADDPWASWYGKPRSSRQDSPSSTLPRVPPGSMSPSQHDGQGYNGQGYNGQGYEAQGYDAQGYEAQGYAGPHGGPPAGPGGQQYGPGPHYGPGQQYPATEVYGGQQYPGQQFGGPQQYAGQGPGGNGAYGDPAGRQMHSGPYTDPMPYADQQYADQQYADQQYGPGQYGGPGMGGPGRRRGGGSRGPLIPVLAIGAVAVVAIVALVFASNGGGSPSPSATGTGTAAGGPTASASAPAADSGTAERRAATQLSVLVSQSGKYLSAVNAGVSDVESCKSLRAARADFGNSARNRQGLLARLGTLPDRSALPPALIADLTGAWQASIKVDSDLHDWAQDEMGGCDPKKVTSDPNYQDSLGYDTPATASKQRFARAWKPIAAKYNLPAYQWSQL